MSRSSVTVPVSVNVIGMRRAARRSRQRRAPRSGTQYYYFHSKLLKQDVGKSPIYLRQDDAGCFLGCASRLRLLLLVHGLEIDLRQMHGRKAGALN